MDFDFHVGGIEDGIIALLNLLHGQRPDNDDGYLKEIHSYGGELEGKKFQDAIAELSPDFPLMLVAYGDGLDTEAPAKSSVLGEPRTFRHDCDFLVIACANNARGEEAQRRGAIGDVGTYRMIGDVREALSGRRFARRANEIVVTVPNQQLPEGDVLLNLEPLTPVGVEFMFRVPGLTAYAQHLTTYFKWTEPDRRAAGSLVEELILDVTTLNQVTDHGGKPGVKLQ